MKSSKILAILFVGLVFTAHSAVEVYSNRIENTVATPLGAGTTFSVFDGKYYDMLSSNWTSSFSNQRVVNKVQLGWKPSSQLALTKTGVYTLQITSEKWNGYTFVSTVTTQNLMINYNQISLGNMTDQSTYAFEGAHKISVKIIATSGDAGIYINNIYLESTIEVERYYTLESGPIAQPMVNLTPNEENVSFTWNTKKGAAFYELEWVHINNFTTTKGTYVAPSLLPVNFYLNATRIQVTTNNYTIPTIFDHGYIVFRVRPIGQRWNATTAQIERIEGPWNQAESGTVQDIMNTAVSGLQNSHLTIITDYDPAMNWGHQITYAEEGKRLEAVSFVDGLGRQRQSVALNPATNQVLVSNVYYDGMGRPVISDLPTPVSGFLHHYKDFNRADISSFPSYNKEYFDQVGSNLCMPSSKGFSTVYGAGKYYSSSNTDKIGANANIPDAETYPFSRVTYLNDFSGRVNYVASAGGRLRMGTPNTTRYIYPSPNQSELNTLFGVEVGKASHYQKLTTIDANGQAYTTYSDMAGRVVASYMEGEAPSNLSSINTDPVEMDSTVMLSKGGAQNIETVVPSSTLTFTHYVPSIGDYTLDYSLNPQDYQSLCAAPGVCLDCKYDLKIEVYYECNTTPLYTFIDTLTGAAFDASCNEPNNFNEHRILSSLQKGVYTFKKKLSVNQDAIPAYWCYYIEKNSCVGKVSTLFNGYYANEPFEDCAMTTDSALVAAQNQDTLNECDVYRQKMLKDFEPDGQYAKYSVSASGTYISCGLSNNAQGTYPYSIFTSNNALTSGLLKAFFTNPQFHYTDQNGTDVTSAVLDGGMSYFINNYRPEWAEQFLPYHPEYCYLQYCESNNTSREYDEQMSATYEFTAAKTQGYFRPLSANTISAGLQQPNNPTSLDGAAFHQDPFFASTGQGSAYATQMNDTMQDYIVINGQHLSMWAYAYYKVLKDKDSTLCGSSSYIMHCISGHIGKGTFQCELDLVWITFRKAYLEAKEHFVFQAQNNIPGCSNACIENPTPCSGKQGFLSQHKSVFPTQYQIDHLFDGIDVTNPNPNNVLSGQIAVACSTQCEQYANDWITTLSGCAIPQTLIPTLKGHFKSLCMSGCNSSHPMGSSTTPPTITVGVGFTNIKDILTFYGIPESAVCSELLIEEPGPYQSTTALFQTVSVPLDTCGCNLLISANKAFTFAQQNGTLPAGVTNIELYLAYTQDISLEDANSLLCTCDLYYNSATNGWKPNANALLIQQGITVPKTLSCATNCVNCAQVQTGMTALLARFNQPSFQAFQNLQNAPILLKNFFNHSFNFDLTTEEYITFYKGCTATSSASYCVKNPLLDDWRDMMNLLALRGQLLSTNLNLLTENVVYTYSRLQDAGIKSSYSGIISGNMLTGLFQHPTNSGSNCSFKFFLPPNAAFTFSDIVSFGEIFLDAGVSCDAQSISFAVEVGYYSCGKLMYDTLSIATNCFLPQKCVCGDAGQTLCFDPNKLPYTACYKIPIDKMQADAFQAYNQKIDAAYKTFTKEYNAKCAAAFPTEYLALTGLVKRYQYTLFYYDQAGNLAKTVAPKGVNKLPLANNAIIDAARASVVSSSNFPAVVTSTPNQNKPAHNFETSYKYNSYNQLVETSNPDQQGATKFWYDYYGRIVASQNPVQAEKKMYSYSLYDAYGRPVEVGQLSFKIAIVTPSPVFDPSEAILKQDDKGAAFKAWVYASFARTEVTITTYDQPLSNTIPTKFATGKQQNLRLRVATVAYYDKRPAEALLPTAYTSAIHYSYDIHGNVIEQLQDVPLLAPVQQDVKSTQYDVELLSGNVNAVHYQKGKADQFTHRYTYDAINRLSEVFTTSDNGTHTARQAHYRYYDYGPLARVEIGQHKVQGMDYTYTINGWLKGMNSSLLNTSYDMGKDGKTGYLTNNNSVHNLFANDVAAYTIGYFNNDYKAIDVPNSKFEAAYAGTPFANQAPELFNGNIRNLVTSISGMPSGEQTLGSTYRYDQLQRLTQMDAFYLGAPNTNAWQTTDSVSPKYFSSYKYDSNGNITNLVRNSGNANSLAMDNLTYRYPDNTSTGKPWNRLSWVDDAVTASSVDVKDQAASNYTYDALGQLTGDVDESIQMTWRYGDKKISKLTHGASKPSSPNIEFVYNPFGQRVVKIVKPRNAGVEQAQSMWTYTYYSYDANGQVMAVYNVTMNAAAPATNTARIDEHHIYGASRLGMFKSATVLYTNNTATANPVLPSIVNNIIGKTYFEVTNYLGNVNAVITDRKIFNTSLTPSLFSAAVVSTSDYYPFGMQMKERASGSNSYRYGFQNQENDGEIKGNGNSVNYRYRMHDPRLGRFFAIDPLASKYPHNSPYAFSENRVIDGVELEGCEYISIHVRIKNDGSMERIKVVDHREVMTEDQVMKVHGMTKDKFYEEHSQTYEGKGPGVLYIYYRVDKNGNDSLIGQHMEMDSPIAEYGLYQGGGCVSLYGGNDDDNPFVSTDKFIPDYSFDPNDFQDFNAKMHDMDQERLTDVTTHKDPRTLNTDERFMQNLYRDKQNLTDKNWVDPFTGRKPSEDAGTALSRAIFWFNKFEMPKKQETYGLPVRYIPIYDDGIYDKNDKNVPEDVL